MTGTTIMRMLWMPAVALLGLTSACASNVGSTIPSASSPVASAPAPVAGYDWHFTPSEEAVYLAYGVAESDDLRLGLHCDVGSGKVEISAPGPAGMREIYLESGGETERFPAQGEASELHDGDFVTAEASSSAPVFQRFRRVGWMAQWVGGEREVYAPHPGSEAGVERFFARCG